jgi:hypothetical protein
LGQRCPKTSKTFARSCVREGGWSASTSNAPRVASRLSDRWDTGVPSRDVGSKVPAGPLPACSKRNACVAARGASPPDDSSTNRWGGTGMRYFVSPRHRRPPSMWRSHVVTACNFGISPFWESVFPKNASEEGSKAIGVPSASGRISNDSWIPRAAFRRPNSPSCSQALQPGGGHLSPQMGRRNAISQRA